jgi:LPS sulfotransferase NodH
MYFHHKCDHVFEGAPPPSVSYMVCSLPRSGSSLLCDLLASTELAGAPSEYFDTNQMLEFQRAWGVSDFEDYLESLVAKKTSLNGVFGLKAHYHQLVEAFEDREVAGVFPKLRLVYIRRADRVRQAVSFARAMQTEQWSSLQEAPAALPVYDAQQIRQMLEWIEREEDQWEQWFAGCAAPVFRVVYEQLVRAIEPTVVAVLRFLDVELPAGFELPEPTLQAQADDLNEDWAARYRRETGAA